MGHPAHHAPGASPGNWPASNSRQPGLCSSSGVRLGLMQPESAIAWVDSAYTGKLVDWAKQHLNLTIKPVSRPRTPPASSCCPAAGRRTAWMMPASPATRGPTLIQHSETLTTWAANALMTRRPARQGATPGRPRRPAPAGG